MRILAAVDETADSPETVRLAARLAARPDDEIVAVCVVEPLAFAHGRGAGLGPAASGPFLMPAVPLDHDRSERLREAVPAVLEQASCVSVIVAREGTPERLMTIAVEGTDADLVIVPARTPRSRLEALILGDPWGPVLAIAASPVLAARSCASGPLSILVVLDDPQVGADAIRALQDILRDQAAQVLLLGLVPGHGCPSGDRERRRMVRRTDAATRSLRRRGVRATSLLLRRAADQVVSTARDVGANLVVLGIRGDSAGTRPDRAARAVLAGAPGSVLRVPSPRQRRTRPSARGGGPR